MKLKESYKPRSIRFLELWENAGWQMKVYGITYEGKDTDPKLIEASKALAAKLLPQPAVTADYYGVGFIGIHQGRSYDFVFIDWWNYETELCQHSFLRPSGQPDVLEPLQNSELSSDVWDLYLLAFERSAWVEEVLKRADNPDTASYLQRRLNEDI